MSTERHSFYQELLAQRKLAALDVPPTFELTEGDLGLTMRSMTVAKANKAELKELARGIVMAQGNLFIKELLRSKKLRIGSTKADFIDSLSQAIDSEELTEEDFEMWLHRVEGWGNQHAYLYRWVKSQGDETWNDPVKVRERVRDAGLLKFWNAKSTLAFPESLILTGVYFEQGRLRLVWHQGSRSMVRDTSKDYEETIDDDRYEFRAYRERAERAVMRFDLRCDEQVAGAFLQVPVSSENHVLARDEILTMASKILGPKSLKAFDIARIMRKLDQKQLEGGDAFKTEMSRWSGAGAYVEFGASGGGSYRDVDSIREVRLALPASVSGTRAKMVFEAPVEEGPAREVRVNLYGEDRRMWIRSQMTEGQVWTLIDLIRKIG